MLASAKGQACINCGRRDDTVVAAHYTGLRSHMFGKGTGHKCHDLFVADLCYKCHKAFDGEESTPTLPQKIDKSEQFLALICQTLLRRIDQGVISIKGYGDKHGDSNPKSKQ